MKTKAVRLYGANDIRLEKFDLPEMGDDEILAKVVSDSVCMSTHKAVLQGAAHARVPSDVAENPTIMGHEFCGEILAVGKKWQDQFKPGDGFAIQPALGWQGKLDAPGYSYRYVGGNSQYGIIPNEVMECNCCFVMTTIPISTALLQSLFPVLLQAIIRITIPTIRPICMRWVS